jgi:hypothetical protein
LIFLVVLTSLIVSHWAAAQAVRLDGLKDQFGKGKALKLGGALSANGIYYNGNGNYGRAPFSYFINGSMNLNLYGLVNLPFSFTLSNFGSSYRYPIPPNRFSIHPSYKWITGHIGNIAMTFSPYTLNGYLFTGAGVDLEPEGPVKISAIYGRLQRATEYDTANRTVPAAYQRMGFGTKVQFQNTKYRAGVIVFHAADDPQSLQYEPDSLGIRPMENTVVSVNGGAQVLKQIDLSVEYALSALTQDVRAGSTSFYSAWKSQLQYTLHNTLVGATYERIDPRYQTLGAYYMNNDLENITVNAAQPLFNGKVQVAVNAGFQRDNLDGAKSGGSSRSIGSANIAYTPNEKVNTTLSYSNFQTFMRIRPQFTTINRLDNFQNLDTLNYTQVSQNANASLSYTLGQSEEKMRVLSADVSFQQTADEQGGVVKNGNGSQFYNASLGYNLMHIVQGYNFSAAFNATYNTIGRNDFVTLGPIVSFNAKLLKKKLSAGTSLSYNASRTDGTWDNTVLNVRCTGVYTPIRRHSLNLIILNQFRTAQARTNTNDVTVTAGYNFTF